ncbi:hypothetical protein DIE22_34025 [Burkholderia sp. Bp9142]|nr:hypothetical protein DIE22_34025 [Burkholderia sp. Bp9142]RQR54681.1 hypothetical protein DIE21_07545 [Burkholderia sp. Bp9140]
MVRLLPGQQSVPCFAPHGKHRFLITKAGLLRRMQLRGRALLRQRIRRRRDRCDGASPPRSGERRARHC